MAVEANVPQPDAAAAPDSVSEIGVEIPVDGIESLGVNASEEGETPVETPKTDPETRARDFQGRYDRLNAKVGTNLLGVIETVGSGDNVAKLLGQYERALNDPQMGQAIRTFLQTGNVDFPAAGGAAKQEEDEFRDPLEVKLTEELAAVRQELAALKSGQSHLAAERGTEKVGQFTSDFLKANPMTAEQKAEFQQGLDARVMAMTSRSGTDFLQNMTYDGYLSLALPIIEPFRTDIESRRQQTKQTGLAAMATDAPAPSTGATAESRGATGHPKNMRDVHERARASIRRAIQNSS